VKVTNHDQFKNYLVWLVLILMLLNTALMGGLYYSFRASFPTAAAKHRSKQEVARDLADYNRRLAEELGVLERNAVKEALAGFNYDIEVFTGDKLTNAILDQGRRVQEIILREADLMLTDQIIAVLNSDRRVQQCEEQLRFSLHFSEDDLFTIPGDILSLATIEKIKKLIPRDRFTEGWRLEIEIVNGEARQTVPYNLEKRLEALNEELDATRLKLHELKVEAGLAEMTGEGITVELYDEFGATTSSSIIHDADIRDVINELFSSGAKGICLGGQRLIVTSAVRCSGSLIKVNDRLITVNPVVIEAIGDPDLLISGLDIIKNNMELNRGIRFKITREPMLKLPAYTRNSE
jgi:hypothetical protein